MPFLINNRRRHFQPEAHEGDWDFAQGDVPSQVTWNQTAFAASNPAVELYAICPQHNGNGVVALTTYSFAYLDAGTCTGLALSAYSNTSRAKSGGTDLRFDTGALCTRDGKKFLLQDYSANTTLCIRTASTEYDLTTLSATNDSEYNPLGSNTNGEYFIWASISPDGKHVVFATQDANNVCRLRSFDLSTAFDLSSTHTNENVSVLSATGAAWVNPNGYQILQAEYASNTSCDIVLYTLRTAWDVSAISKRVVLGTVTFGGYTSANGLFTNPDGDKIFIVVTTGHYAVVDLSGGGE